MRVLLDSDVLIDVATARARWNKASGAILDCCERGEHEGFVAWHSLANVYYCARKPDRARAREFIRALLGFARVAQVGTEDMAFALNLPMPDLEHAMQAAAAVACRASYIVTRNARHYAGSSIPAISPAEFLSDVAS